MVNIFGEATQNGGVGRRGPRGKRGRDGKGDDYYENYMRYSKFFQHFTWDIDFTPNYWIDGYDIQRSPSFKVLNKYNHDYDAYSPAKDKTPMMGRDPLTGRHTLGLSRNQLMVCKMNWNTDKKSSNDNLQVFLVCKYINDGKKSTKYRDGIFGNGATGRFGRFVAVEMEKSMIVSGANSGEIVVNFDKEHDPLKLDQYSVLSVHWNNKGVGNGGKDKSSVWCNGKKLSTFLYLNVLFFSVMFGNV